MGTLVTLDRVVYGMGQVDRLLKLRSGTARRWIDGYHRGGKHYPPVVRELTTGDELVTWGEFVETRLLAEYRNTGIPMIRMHPVVKRLREELGVPYPLAHARPFAWPEGRELIGRAQEQARLDSRMFIVLRTGEGILELSPPAADFYDSVEWGFGEQGVAEQVRPLGPASPVTLDPLRSFGEPVVRTIRTEVLAEAVAAGDELASVAERFELSESDVVAAVEFERAEAA